MLSVVIPTLDAAASLPAALTALAGVDEIVVVDGGSTDQTADVARAGGAQLIEAERGRGTQLAAGAQAAQGDWLLFLHADTRLGPGWRAVAARHMAKGTEAAAVFRLAFEDPAWQARWIARVVAWRTRALGLPYGDQGLLVPRALYDRVGGYRPLPIMEDVDLVRRIGKERLVMLEAVATTSAARFRRDGWLLRPLRNLACLALWSLGVPPARIARLYG